MARMIPPLALTPYSSEAEVFASLQNDPETADWLILPSVNIANYDRQLMGEVDFVVVVPHLGVLCLEVKGAHEIRQAGGQWYYGTNPQADRSPFRQAADGMHALRTYVQRRRSDLMGVPWWSAVAFTHVTFDEPSPEWHEWQVIDWALLNGHPMAWCVRHVLNQARLFIERQRVGWFQPSLREPAPDQCTAIANVIRPTSSHIETRKALRLRVSEEMAKFTDEQAAILASIAGNTRILVDGLAGTGKTTLAVESAKEAVQAGRRTLFVCFNRFLAQQLREATMGWGQNLRVATLHQFFRSLVAESPQEPPPEYWTEVLPAQALEALDKSGPLYDELIVDEAQDILRPAYVDALELAVSGGLTDGRWRIFGDFNNQVIYEGSPDDPFRLLPRDRFTQLQLRVNCRNPRAIARFLDRCGRSGLAYSTIRRPDEGRQPEVAAAHSPEAAPKTLIHVLETLLSDTRYAPRDLVVLSPHRHQSLARRAADIWEKPLRPYDPESGSGVDPACVQYTSVWAYKGLETPIVILTDFDDPTSVPVADSIQDLFYAGVSRALDRVIVISQHSRGPKWLTDVLAKDKMRPRWALEPLQNR
ncbi:MAG: AAA family ATPase [Clostridia bacterium]